MTQPAALPDGHALSDYYEALRQDVVAAGAGERTLNGRALLMFKGMAAWMKSFDEAPLHALRSATAHETRLPVSIEHNLINVVATMAFAIALGAQT
jgi:hypothetical protein